MAISFLSEDGALPRSLRGPRTTLPRMRATPTKEPTAIMPTLSKGVAQPSGTPASAYQPQGVKNWFNQDLYNQELQSRLQGVNPQGRVFKSWDMFSDGIGNTANDFIKARPDLFGYDAALGSRQLGYGDNGENPTPGTGNYWDFGASNDLLKNYEARRLGQDGVKNGRRDVIVDKRTGEVVYAGMNPYSYDPAKTNLIDAVQFVGGALGGYFGVSALAGMAGGAGTVGAGAGAGAGTAAGGSAIDAALAEAMMSAGTLAPEGVAALIPTGAGLGAAGGGSLLAGGALGGGMGSAAGAAGGLASLPAQATPPITPPSSGPLPLTPPVPTPPPLLPGAATGGSIGNTLLTGLGTAGSNLLDRAIENPLQTAALVGSVGALAGAKPTGTPTFDVEGAAAAQGEANRDASWFDAVLNRPDMQTPWGASTWTLREGADPKNPKPGDWVNTVALNEEQQGLLDAQNRLSAGYASTAEGMLGRVQDSYGQPFDLSSLGNLPDFGALNTDNDRAAIEKALLDRMEPLLQREEERARTRLLNTGFEYGSEGSNIELDRLARGRNDARLAAIAQSGQEASRLMGDQRANLLAALQGRQQGFHELSYERNLPLNELNAFRQGSQVQAPEFQSILPTNTAASPELDALLAQLGVQRGNAANSQAGYNALLQAVAGLGSAWIGG